MENCLFLFSSRFLYLLDESRVREVPTWAWTMAVCLQYSTGPSASAELLFNLVKGFEIPTMAGLEGEGARVCDGIW